MKNKLIQITSVTLLLLFSFYYTEKSIDIIRSTDPIMRQIKKTDQKYNIKSVNANIKDNTIRPGKKGKNIDYNESYKNMKKYGSYNETLTVFKEETPNVSLSNIYDKYVIGGFEEKRSVALVFKVEKTTVPDEIMNILDSTNTKATMFIDGLWLENNVDKVSNKTNIEFEILNYDNTYKEMYFKSALSYLENILGTKTKYCYGDYDNKEIITLCQKLKLHTIIPTIKVGNSPYKEIKKRLQNSAIIYLPISTTTKIELNTVIDYIKSKGYTLEKLDELLSENLEK